MRDPFGGEPAREASTTVRLGDQCLVGRYIEQLVGEIGYSRM
jgi:hypothetical protein